MNLRKHLQESKPAVEAWASDVYYREKQLLSERYANKTNRENDDLKRENNRLFGRLLNIYEVRFITHH